MSRTEQTNASESTAAEQEAAGSDAVASPRADLHDAVGWIIFGAAVVIASLRMSRLEERHINPLTVPGLVPGLLGAGMVIIGLILGVRSWMRGGYREAITPMSEDDRKRRKRVLLAIILCCGYSLVLLGHGLPFWLASWIYVSASIILFDHLSADPAKRRFSARGIAKALLIGVLSSVAVWLVFEELFLVRLP